MLRTQVCNGFGLGKSLAERDGIRLTVTRDCDRHKFSGLVGAGRLNAINKRRANNVSVSNTELALPLEPLRANNHKQKTSHNVWPIVICTLKVR